MPYAIFGPILDDRLKEKFLKPWKGVLCIHFRVCVSVCLCVRGLQSTPVLKWLRFSKQNTKSPIWKKTRKNAPRIRKNQNFEKQTNAFLSHYPKDHLT